MQWNALCLRRRCLLGNEEMSTENVSNLNYLSYVRAKKYPATIQCRAKINIAAHSHSTDKKKKQVAQYDWTKFV